MTCTANGQSHVWDFSPPLLRKRLWLAAGMGLSLQRRMRLLGEDVTLATKNVRACNQMVRCLGLSPDPRGTAPPLRADPYEGCLGQR